MFLKTRGMTDRKKRIKTIRTNKLPATEETGNIHVGKT